MTALNQSQTLTNQLQTGPRRMSAGDFDTDLRQAHDKDTVVTGQGVVDSIILPPGNIRLLKENSRIYTGPAVWANAGVTVTVGWKAYTDAFGVVQPASANGFLTVQSPQAGVVDLSLTMSAAPYLDFNTQNGLIVQFTIAVADKAAGDVLELLFIYCEIGAGT